MFSSLDRLTSRILAAAFILAAAHSNAAAVPFNVPAQPSPGDGATRQWIVVTLGWYVTNQNNTPLKYDLYWGTDPNPPLYALNVPVGTPHVSYPMGTAAYATTYYWRVVVRDTPGNETSGPTWSYTTRAANEPPDVPLLASPSNGAVMVPVNVTLDYSLYDFEGVVANADVYIGTDPNPPLVGDHVSADKYKPPVLAPSTLYYWRVVSRDAGGLETGGPTWTFTTINSSNQMPDDPSNPRPLSYSVTDSPLLQWDGTDADSDSLYFDVYFGSGTNDNHPMQLLGTTTEHSFQVGPLNLHTRYFWRVVARDEFWTVRGQLWWFDYGSVPVLFSRFAARERENDVEVSWHLQSDEAMDSYTLYRREGNLQRIAIANAPVQEVDGSYVDGSVKPGTTYHYELLVRTLNGDEYRSPVATVATAALGVTLYQNVPNPFNPVTTIRYDLPAAVRVQLSIVDVSGRRVRTLVDELQTPGSRDAVWNGRDDAGRGVASGVYFSVLQAGKQRLTKKLVLLK